MKRLVAIALFCAIALFTATGAGAVKYGVVTGATFPDGWHAGGTMQFKLPAGFSVQPSLMYNYTSQNNLELPVSLQWGPDLLVFRPYIEVAPYAGYQFIDAGRLGYGLGVGGGIEFWRVQVSCRYNWGLDDIVQKYRGATLSVAFLFGK